MSKTPNPAAEPWQPPVYRIRIRGHLGPRWENWFGDVSIRLEDNGDTLLTGPVIDQAALHGLLRQIRDLGLPLISIEQIEPGPDERVGCHCGR